MKAVALVLAHCNADDVNSSVSPRDARSPIHLASSLGNLAFVQLLIWVSLNLKSLSESIFRDYNRVSRSNNNISFLVQCECQGN